MLSSPFGPLEHATVSMLPSGLSYVWSKVTLRVSVRRAGDARAAGAARAAARRAADLNCMVVMKEVVMRVIEGAKCTREDEG